ncbi:MAG TPA: chromate resistance protein ChrB domain-containing protein [Candidatus Acidoferrales bacterium]|nr:chromate resistance protein ChrB domain-containing protein [Candidatus Acidoferrales bacterium]
MSVLPQLAQPSLEPQAPAWLLLVHQLPVRPSNVRVKTWRRLQNLGAVAVKDSVYVLPNTPQAREDFEWLKAEIMAMKGQATVFAADVLEAAAKEEITGAFQKARQRDYQGIAREAQRLLWRGAANRGRSPDGRRLRRLHALRERFARTQAVDFFRAPGRDEAQGALDELQYRLKRGGVESGTREGDSLMASAFRDRLWVTRPRPGIDRMASAWLIRRFIDPAARFCFAEEPEAESTAVPFDMFGVEFGHQGDCCTFEMLVRRFGIRSQAIERIAQIVHSLDLKDEKYPMEGATAVGQLVDGLRQLYSDDHALLEQGITIFEALYRSLAGGPAERNPAKARRGRLSPKAAR